MATVVTKASGNLNASNNCKVGYGNIGTASIGISTFYAITSARTTAITFSSNHNVLGVVACFNMVAGTDRDVTVTLQEYVASVWTDRVSVTVTNASIIGGSSATDGTYWTKCQFASAYAVDTSAGKWRFSFIQSGGSAGTISIGADSGTTNKAFTYSDTDGTFTSGDIIVAAHDVTINTTASMNLYACEGVSVTVNDSITATFKNLALSKNCSFLAGSSGSPHSACIIDINNGAGVNAYIGGAWAGHEAFPNLQYCSSYIWKMYGTKRATRRARVKYARVANDTSFKTTDDVSAWQNGDEVVFTRRSGVARGATSADTTIYTLSGAPTGPVGGEYTVNLTSGLSSQGIPAHNDAGQWTYAVNLSGYGIVFKNSNASSTTGWNFTTNLFLQADVNGVRFQDVGRGISASGLTVYSANLSAGEESLKGPILIDNCAIIGVTANTKNSPAVFLGIINPAPGFDTTISNVHAHMAQIFITADIHFTSTDNSTIFTDCSEFCWQKTNLSKTFNSGSYVTNFQLSNFMGSIIFDGFVHSANGMSLYQGAGDTTLTQSFTPQGTGLTINNLFIDDCDIAVKTTPSKYVLYNNANNWKLGTETANGTDYEFSSSLFDIDVLASNLPNFDIAGTQTGHYDGTSIRFRELNGDVTDFRSFTSRGSFTSQSSATKLRARHLVSAKPVIADFILPTNTCAGGKIYVKANVEILNAAYYGGTYTAPSILLTYNDGANTNQGNATATTGQQTIYAFGLSSVDNRNIYVRLASKTDVLTSSGDVDWSSFLFTLRKYGSVYQLITIPIYRLFGPSETLYSFPSITTNALITQTTKATVAAYSGISINHGTGTLTITANHTLSEVYDYSQYNLELDANLGYAEWLTSADGSTFDCSYNIVVDNCTLSGDGRINAPGKSLTLQNGGNVTFPVTYSAGTRVPLAVTGLVTGSRVRIQKTSDGTLISEGTVSGTTYTAYYVWTTNLGVTLRVRKSSAAPKYLPYESAGTISNAGLEMIAAQVADTIA